MFKRDKKQRVLRIGIYAGTFNPVHAGHVAFALQAMQAAKLDKVYFLPERRPRYKQGVEHFGHRVAMLKRAVQPHPGLAVLELDDISFSVQRTLPKLKHCFPGSQLVLLMGSDTAAYVSAWPLVHRLFKQIDIVVGLRTNYDKQKTEQHIKTWVPQPAAVMLLDSHAPDVSSHKIREALAARVHVKGLLRSVAQYSNRHWLYVSLP